MGSIMKSINFIKDIVLVIIIIWFDIFGQSEAVAPKQNPNPVQVTVSGNHPDAIANKSTVIFDNTKNIDLRSYERPIKNTIPPSDTEEELFLPNEVIPTFSIEEKDLKSLPETQPIRDDEYIKEPSNDFPHLILNNQEIVYTGTRKQNINLMKALGIRPGWSNNKKWPDGTDIDDYSIVDWIKAGMGEPIGIDRDANIEVRKNLYNKYYIAN